MCLFSGHGPDLLRQAASVVQLPGLFAQPACPSSQGHCWQGEIIIMSTSAAAKCIAKYTLYGKKWWFINIPSCLSFALVPGVCTSFDERFGIREDHDSGQGVREWSREPPAVVPQTESHVGLQLCENNHMNFRLYLSVLKCNLKNATCFTSVVWNISEWNWMFKKESLGRSLI